MSHPVHTGDLNIDRLEQAWPLVREVASGVSLESWCAFARAMLSPIDPETSRRGILVAERKRTIRGLMTYETSDDLTRGRSLLLRNAVIMDLALREHIAEALRQRSLDVAHQAQCSGLILEVVPQMAWIGQCWQAQADLPGVLPVLVVGVAPPVAEPRTDQSDSINHR